MAKLRKRPQPAPRKVRVARIANNGLSIGHGSKEKVFPKRDSRPR